MLERVETMALTDLLAQGGWAMYPIYACSVLTLGTFVKKALDLRAARMHDVGWFDGVLERVRSGDIDGLARACRGIAHPGARVVAAILVALERAPQHAEAEARRTAAVELERLERGVGLLSFLAQVSPLLGLLGTVLGMVDLFVGLQGAGDGNLAIGDLASGIWKALLTTAAGLTVAVPALAAHTFLTSRFDRVRLFMLDMAQRVLFTAGIDEDEPSR
jgi:biopolymer transport protein ExbB